MKLINVKNATVAEMILNENENNNEFVISEKINEEIVVEDVIDYKIYNIPLNSDLQKLLQDECNKYDLS